MHLVGSLVSSFLSEILSYLPSLPITDYKSLPFRQFIHISQLICPPFYVHSQLIEVCIIQLKTIIFEITFPNQTNSKTKMKIEIAQLFTHALPQLLRKYICICTHSFNCSTRRKTTHDTVHNKYE